MTNEEIEQKVKEICPLIPAYADEQTVALLSDLVRGFLVQAYERAASSLCKYCAGGNSPEKVGNNIWIHRNAVEWHAPAVLDWQQGRLIETEDKVCAAPTIRALKDSLAVESIAS